MNTVQKLEGATVQFMSLKSVGSDIPNFVSKLCATF